MKEVGTGIKVSGKLYNILDNASEKSADFVFVDLAQIVRQFSGENKELLKERSRLQDKIDSYLKSNESLEASDFVGMLQKIGYISEASGDDVVSTQDISQEVYPMAGPQLVVPADKVNMVLNAANARWVSLYDSLYTSNIIDEGVTGVEERKKLVIGYSCDFLQKIAPLDGLHWEKIVKFSYNGEAVEVKFVKGEVLSLSSDNGLIGYTLENEQLSTLIFEHNNLKTELVLQDGGIKDIQIESALTYIIDLEDASISAPDNKYEAYRIIKGIVDGDLECEVRGKTRKMRDDTKYICVRTGEEKNLCRTSVALVRDVGPHMLADESIITIGGEAIPEKILDMFITSLLGMRYHVAPKMHGAEEVRWNIKLWDEINKLQQLPENSNKIGIMNEELRTNAQLRDCVVAAKDIVFFTNTGFLDYTGSFIDLMMHRGAIAPYRDLPSKLYKTSYEQHNVNVSLQLKVPQIGAGMWPAIKDMAGLLKSKEGQVKGLTDTGWSPSPMAAAIHAMAFHLFGNVRDMQSEYAKNMKSVNINDLFEFPGAKLDELNEQEIIENIDFAVHGLLAYAEPWVRRGIGCSGIKDLGGVLLMEDRATARIKAAFVRNWLLHEVITSAQIEDSLARMANLVNEQNAADDDYLPLNSCDEVYVAVHELIFNPQNLNHSYVEPYFYAAHKRCLLS